MNRRELILGGTAAVAVLSQSASGQKAAARAAKSGGALIVDGLDTSEITRDYILTARSVGINCIHKSMGSLRTFSLMYEFVDKNSDILAICRSVEEIRSTSAEGKVALIFGWQGADVVANNRSGTNDWWGTPPKTELRAYYELGLRFVGIAYQIANIFGGGGTDTQMGLSRAGRALVEQVHSLKMVLDVAGHTGDQASLDAIEMSKGIPVVCTHGNARHLANSSRNLPDILIDKIAQSGGVIGMNAINDFVMRGKEMATVEPTPQGTVRDLVRHATYIRNRVGAEHVGLGPDFTSGASENPNRAPGIRDYPMFGPEVIDKSPRRFVSGFEDISKFRNIEAALRDDGWSAPEICGFMGENWLRVYKQIWGK
ncbi:membrane dipeptidase [Sphingobium sp. JAI105]|uniref:dipeptidase n=1 Tax=Sphingobium sp. JAI105 TaxID=2787715 RepID=UPI0018C94367|nr:membrane dipeptidase [Sphingobium sp. JAI105]MBG6118460.1 membrane dipeptidase [Sphingobium sp. JAI105]